MPPGDADARTPVNVLVTGGCGFIGSAFIRFLFRCPDFAGEVTNLDLCTYAGNPSNLEGAVDEARYFFAQGDISDQALVSRLCDGHAVDTIVNFAAESHVDRSIHSPGVFIQTNVVGTFSLLEVVRSHPGIHLHHVSTDEVYGSLGAEGRFDEESCYRPNSPYAASKAASDHLVRAYARTYGVKATLSHSSNNYGPCQFPEKLIPLMILNMLEGKSLPIYGTGTNVRDWVFVEDHAEAIWMILGRGASGQTYDIGGEEERTNLEVVSSLVDAVSALAGIPEASLRKLITFVEDRPGHDLRYAIDCTKLRSQLGWKPQHDFDRGIRETVKWYLDNPQWIAGVRTGAYREWMKTNYASRGPGRR